MTLRADPDAAHSDACARSHAAHRSSRDLGCVCGETGAREIAWVVVCQYRERSRSWSVVGAGAASAPARRGAVERQAAPMHAPYTRPPRHAPYARPHLPQRQRVQRERDEDSACRGREDGRHDGRGKEADRKRKDTARACGREACGTRGAEF